MSKVMQFVYVRAESVEQCGHPGVFRINLEGQELTDDQRALLAQLYPHLLEQAQELLAKEALLAAMIEPPQPVEAAGCEKKHKKISKPYTPFPPDDSIATKATY